MSESSPPETAWKIHDALIQWTSNVDSKASFALTIESAALGAILTFSDPTGPLGHLQEKAALYSYRVGLILLTAGVLAAVVAVIPQVRWTSVSQEANDNFIFFGHLRHREADGLAEQIARADPLPVLSRQLVVMSKIAWRKHVALQVSLVLTVLGAFLAVIAPVLER